MLDYIQPYLDYFTANPEWALVIIFLIALGEALLIIGLFVPSTAVLVGAGVLVGTGHLQFWPVIIATCLGCIAGDQFSYWAGRMFGERLKTMWPLHLYPQLVAKGEDFVREHGGKSIAIGRFVPGVKSVVPGIVGMFGMNQLFFVFVNVTSGIFWSFAHVVPGVLIGQGLAFAGELSGRLLVVLLVLLVILALAGFVIRLAAAGVSPFLNHLLSRVSDWARAQPRPLLAALRQGRLAGQSALGDDRAVRGHRSSPASSRWPICRPRRLEQRRLQHRRVHLHADARDRAMRPADELMTVITMMGDTMVMSALALAIIGWLVWHKAYRAAWAAGIAIVAAKLFELAMKLGIQRARPTELSYSGASIFSFPSGHATMAAVIFGILAVLVSHSMGRWGRAVVYAICAILVVAIAYSRIYLGAHWLSDVLAGLTFGVVMMAAFGVAIEAIPPRRIKPLGLFATALVVFLGVGALHVATGFTRASDMYAMPEPQTWCPSRNGWRRTGRSFPPAASTSPASRRRPSSPSSPATSTRCPHSSRPAAGPPPRSGRGAQSLPYLNPNASASDLAAAAGAARGPQGQLTLTRSVPGETDDREVIRIYKTGLATAEGRPTSRSTS